MKKLKQKKHPGLQVKAGCYVIAFPIEYRISMSTVNGPDSIAQVLGEQTFGAGSFVVGLDDEVYSDAICLLEKVVLDGGDSFDVVDPIELQVKIADAYKYLRVIDTRRRKR